MRGITRNERVKRRRQKRDSPSFKENIESGSPVAAPSKRLQRHGGTETNNESLGAISFVSQTIVDIEQFPPSLVSRKGKERKRNGERG